jgi:Concanavalin A-like lectin/glucanases superfamily
MRRKLVHVRITSLSLLLAVLSIGASAQQVPQEVSFCPAGVHADGFINWSSLPKAPAVAFGGGQVGTVTKVIPVSGVPGLNATVTIQGVLSSPGVPLYQVLNPADLYLSVAPNNTPVLITFSSPVKGFTASFRSYGRFSHGFQMMANDVDGNTISADPPPAQVEANGFERGTDLLATANLQIESVVANLTSASFDYGGDPVENFSFDLINLRVESGNQPDPVSKIPTNGLKAWFRGDKTGANSSPYFTVPNPGYGVGSWPDQSGNGHNATGSATLILAGPNCTPVVSFGGNQALKFDLPVTGWSGMTTVMVTQSFIDGSGSSNAALYWGPAGWGETFVSPFQTSVWYRFGSHPGIVPVYTRPVDLGGDFTITTTMHSPSTDSLYVNGVLAYQLGAESSTIQGSSATGIIGGGHGGSFFTGNIGEILIYDRALSDTEREQVEQYLRTKYLY